MREQIIKRILEKKIIAIVRGVYHEDCLRLAEALCAGGIDLLEVTFDQSRQELWQQTVDTIGELGKAFGDDMLFGSGTVTSVETLRYSIEAGAKFIISPDTNEEVIKGTRKANLVSIPGAMTPTEIALAYRYGADFVKLFPAANMGSAYLKAIRAPLSHVPIMVVGGIDENNIEEFFQAGAVGAGVGGNLVNKRLIANGEFDQITDLARRFVRNIAEARG